jgi:hypothetical protein
LCPEALPRIHHHLDLPRQRPSRPTGGASRELPIL